MGDVGDGDRDDVAAGIVRIGIGRGVHGVVVILGVDRIDGDERQLPPVLAAGERRRLCRVRLASAPRPETRAECRGRGWRSG